VKKLGPKQKRAAEVAGIAGLLLLVVMLARRQNAANAPSDTATDGQAAGAAVPTNNAAGGAPADFSGEDSGNLSELGNMWAGSLGDLGTGLATVGTNQGELAGGQQTILDQVTPLAGSLGVLQNSVDDITTRLDAAGPFAPATAGTPSPAAIKPATRKAAAVKPKTIIKASAKHGGKAYVYHVTPGKKPVAVRAATHAVKPKAAPHRTPSQAPRGSHRAPARKKAKHR
jgi:hypothetical protein